MIGLTKLAAGPGNVELSEREERFPGPGEALLTVRRAGICGTDLHIEAAEFPCAPPVTMGHEVCGVVAEVGAGVDPSWLGARVVCETYFSACGRCGLCRDGRRNLCPERRSIGSFADGAFAPRLIVPALNLHQAPAALGDAACTLIEPIACLANCLFDPNAIAPGDDVLVTGPWTDRAAGRATRARGRRQRLRCGPAVGRGSAHRRRGARLRDRHHACARER